MASCELCGSEANLVIAVIEGVSINVCNNCKGYGKVIEEPRGPEVKRVVVSHEGLIETIVLNCAELIKNKREKMGLTQKEFSMKLNIKEGFVSKLENGNIRPNLDMAKKIGKLLNLNLITKEKFSDVAVKPSGSQGFTIGDFVKDK